MATTGTVVHELVVGARDTAGAVVASGIARFYQPGTLVAQTVYSDNACASAYSQPITLNAAGQKLYVYTLEPVRMIVKESTDTTTRLDIDPVNSIRADASYLTHASLNGGAETTVEAQLVAAAGSLGSGFQFLPTATATARNYVDVIRELRVSVVDFQADPLGVTDSTTYIQAASDYAESLGGGVVYFPKGTFKITSAITIDTAGVSWQGAGRGIAQIKQYSTTANALTVNLGSAIDAKLFIRDLSFTCSTTSSGAAVSVTNGDRIAIERVGSDLFRGGLDVSAIADGKLLECVVNTTDDNASAVGYTLGARCRAVDCDAVSGTTNGTGFVLGQADAKVIGGRVSKFATGVTMAGAGTNCSDTKIASSTTGITANGTAAAIRGVAIASVTTGITLSGTGARAADCYITTVTTGINASGGASSVRGCAIVTATTNVILAGAGATASANYCASGTTGISMTAASTVAAFNTLDTCTTGISGGAVANLRINENYCTGCGTDVSISASATAFYEVANTYARDRMARITRVTSAVVAPSWTPDTECTVWVGESTYTAGNATPAINATATAGLVAGQELTIVLQKVGANDMVPVFNAQYVIIAGTSGPTTGRTTTHVFKWSATATKWIATVATANINSGTPW